MSRPMPLDRDNFELLLAWLSEDRERAGRRYETIRRGLVKFFICRGCAAAEELADITIDRVAGKVKQLAPEFRGQPASYFFRVGHFVSMEYLRRKRTSSLKERHLIDDQSDSREESDEETYNGCLESCLKLLPAHARELILDYYVGVRGEKILRRKKLAERMRISATALRVRAHRLRRRLEECVADCVAPAAQTDP